VCRKRFLTRPNCLTHILSQHPAIQLPAGSKCRTGGRSGKPLSCPRCGYTTTHPQLLRLHFRQEKCIPVIARNADLQQIPPYLGIPESGNSHSGSKQDFVLQAFLMAHPERMNGIKSDGSPPPLPEPEEPEAAASSPEDNQFIPSVILLPVNRRIANPLSVTFSLTPA